MSKWYSLDGCVLSDAERRTATSLSRALDDVGGATTVQATALDANANPLATVLVLERAAERILLVIRPDRSVLVATDDATDLDAWGAA